MLKMVKSDKVGRISTLKSLFKISVFVVFSLLVSCLKTSSFSFSFFSFSFPRHLRKKKKLKKNQKTILKKKKQILHQLYKKI